MLLIQLIIVYIIDICGFVPLMKKKIFRWLYGPNIKYVPIELKPFDCSLCLTFWILIIYALIVNIFTIKTLIVICILSYSTTLSKEVYYLIYDTLLSFINYIRKKLKINQ